MLLMLAKVHQWGALIVYFPKKEKVSKKLKNILQNETTLKITQIISGKFEENADHSKNLKKILSLSKGKNL